MPLDPIVLSSILFTCRHTTSTSLTNFNKTVEKTKSSPDYSVALGSVLMAKGEYTWRLKVEKDLDGVWIGVTSPGANTGAAM